MSLAERVVSGVLGVVLGSLVGLGLAFLFGVFSQRMGPGHGPEVAAPLIAGAALVFGLLGLALGSHAGSVLGEFIAAMFALEGASDREWSSPEVPGWVVSVVLVGVVLVVVALVR